jgi:hypothetical protein
VSEAGRSGLLASSLGGAAALECRFDLALALAMDDDRKAMDEHGADLECDCLRNRTEGI